MEKIIIKSQEEFDKIKRVEANQEVIVEVEVELKFCLEVYGVIRGAFKSSWNIYLKLRGSSHAELWESSHAELRGSSHAELWGSSHAVLRESSHAELWESSHAVLWGSSHAVLRGSSHAVLWESSHAELWESSHAVLRGSSHAVLRESSHAELRGSSHAVLRGSSQSIVNDFYFKGKLQLFGFSIASIPFGLKLKIKKEKNALIQKYKLIEDYFEREGVELKGGKCILFKRVSKDFKTQEGTENETLWKVGEFIEHKDWQPESGECGAGKFHGCSRPFFGDEFRSTQGDVYIAIEVKKADTFQWKKPQYPHKIGFRKGKVLYQCDRYGVKI